MPATVNTFPEIIFLSKLMSVPDNTIFSKISKFLTNVSRKTENLYFISYFLFNKIFSLK